MQKEKIHEIANSVIDEMQSITKRDANKEELIYLMAYNDGVLDLMKVLISEIEADKTESEE